MTEEQGGITQQHGGITQQHGGITEEQGGITQQHGGITEEQGGIIQRQCRDVQLTAVFICINHKSRVGANGRSPLPVVYPSAKR
ncbi:MAG: hypothetical protein HC899_01990 [Leptolyngbyaceae cyanobacterium SM1_4_3]|nr:hypothetical protein [Leptolyngbyaceae cyanobacterium SM1_4_3]